MATPPANSSGSPSSRPGSGSRPAPSAAQTGTPGTRPLSSPPAAPPRPAHTGATPVKPGPAIPAGSPAGAPAQPAPVSRPATRASTRTSGRGQTRDIAAERQALGLTALKPSEMIAGLEQAAERAAKLESRESDKRKAGGKIIANEALKIDDTGRRWAWQVRIGLAVIALLVIAVSVVLVRIATDKTPPAREVNLQARNALSELKLFAAKTKWFAEDETGVTTEKVKQRLKAKIEDELLSVQSDIEAAKKDHRPVLAELHNREIFLKQLCRLKDALDQDFVFTPKDSATFEVAAVGKAEGDSKPPSPVVITVRIQKK